MVAAGGGGGVSCTGGAGLGADGRRDGADGRRALDVAVAAGSPAVAPLPLAPGAGGSAFMILTAGIEAADGKFRLVMLVPGPALADGLAAVGAGPVGPVAATGVPFRTDQVPA